MFKYGFAKKSGKRTPIIPTGRTPVPISPPKKVYHDRTSKCIGCPYPTHGLMCHDDRLDGSCLRSDMQELDARHQRVKLTSEPHSFRQSETDVQIASDREMIIQEQIMEPVMSGM